MYSGAPEVEAMSIAESIATSGARLKRVSSVRSRSVGLGSQGGGATAVDATAVDAGTRASVVAEASRGAAGVVSVDAASTTPAGQDAGQEGARCVAPNTGENKQGRTTGELGMDDTLHAGPLHLGHL